MKKFKFKIDGKSYEVSVDEQQDNLAEVIVNGKSYSVEIEKEAVAQKSVVSKVATKKPATTATAKPVEQKQNISGGAKSIKSPLPGSITKIVVTTGQSVKKGELLLIMESMKMENNILADKDGIVGNIYVQAGQSVLQGDSLVDLG